MTTTRRPAAQRAWVAVVAVMVILAALLIVRLQDQEAPDGPTRSLTPTNVAATVNGTTVNLDWDDSPDPTFAYFAVRRATQPDTNTDTWTRLPPNYTESQASDTALAPGTYYYYVTKVSKTGVVSPRSETVSATVAAPVSPIPATPTPSTPGSVIWGSTFEDGNLGVYRTVRKEGSGTRGSHVITTERARTGSRSLKITLPSATSGGTVGRYQLVANTPNETAGLERWYGVSLYLGNDWDLAQIRDNRDFFVLMWGFRYTQTGTNGPGSNLFNTTNGRNWATETITAPDQGTNKQILGAIQKGCWIDFVMHIKWSTGSDGFREVWQDGRYVGRVNGRTLYQNSRFEHRVGFYEGTGVNHTRTLYVDNHRVGTSYTAVDPSR